MVRNYPRRRLLRLLLERGADPTMGTNATGKTPLHDLAVRGNTVELTLAKAATTVDVRLNDKGQGATPLQIAVQQGHAGTVSVLLKHGANVNAVQPGNGSAGECVLRRPSCGSTPASLRFSSDSERSSISGISTRNLR